MVDTPNFLEKIIKAFEQYPAILALLVVIYLMYLIIRSKDVTIKDLIAIAHGDIQRNSRVVALLEMLVYGKKEA